MEKVFSYAKIASICSTALFAALCIFVYVIHIDNIPFVSISLIGRNALWLFFFVFLILSSNKKSVLITPSIIGIIGFLLCIIVEINEIRVINEYVSVDGLTIPTISQFRNIERYVYLPFPPVANIIVFVAMIWLAEYNKKRSLQRISLILYPVCIIMAVLLSRYSYLIDINANGIFVASFVLLAYYIPTILFFFSFTKLKY